MSKDFNIIDSGYAESKHIFDEIKKEWKIKNPLAKVKRVKTDTKGLIMFWVIEEKENKI